MQGQVDIVLVEQVLKRFPQVSCDLRDTIHKGTSRGGPARTGDIISAATSSVQQHAGMVAGNAQTNLRGARSW